MIAYLTGEILRLIHQLEIDVFLSAERREKMEHSGSCLYSSSGKTRIVPVSNC